MTIREVTIAKLQKLPEPLLQQVNDFIDFLTFKQGKISANSQPQEDVARVWQRWFESVDYLEITPSDPISDYQQLLLDKYRQQGLEL